MDGFIFHKGYQVAYKIDEVWDFDSLTCVAHAMAVDKGWWEGEGAERIRRQFGESVDRLCRVVEVAEAAIALSEYQAFAAFDPNVEAAVYFRERGRLWEAFMQAHKAAKDANQS